VYKHRNKGHAFVPVTEDSVVNFYQYKLHHFCMLPIYIGTSKNRTTYTEEISTTKSSDVTLHKSMTLISSFDIYLKYKCIYNFNLELIIKKLHFDNLFYYKYSIFYSLIYKKQGVVTILHLAF